MAARVGGGLVIGFVFLFRARLFLSRGLEVSWGCWARGGFGVRIVVALRASSIGNIWIMGKRIVDGS